MAMRYRATLSCRFPDRATIDRTFLRPDQCGMGATPAWRANAASLRNRDTPAVSPMSLAAVSSAQPKTSCSDGAAARTRAAMNKAIPDVVVSGYANLIAAIDLPDPDDRHVVAAAIRAGAQAIVTSNLKDFPKEMGGSGAVLPE